jgi:hypothetical protein
MLGKMTNPACPATNSVEHMKEPLCEVKTSAMRAGKMHIPACPADHSIEQMKDPHRSSENAVQPAK